MKEYHFQPTNVFAALACNAHARPSPTGAIAHHERSKRILCWSPLLGCWTTFAETKLCARRLSSNEQKVSQHEDLIILARVRPSDATLPAPYFRYWWASTTQWIVDCRHRPPRGYCYCILISLLLSQPRRPSAHLRYEIASPMSTQSYATTSTGRLRGCLAGTSIKELLNIEPTILYRLAMHPFTNKGHFSAAASFGGIKWPDDVSFKISSLQECVLNRSSLSCRTLKFRRLTRTARDGTITLSHFTIWKKPIKHF